MVDRPAPKRPRPRVRFLPSDKDGERGKPWKITCWVTPWVVDHRRFRTEAEARQACGYKGGSTNPHYIPPGAR